MLDSGRTRRIPEARLTQSPTLRVATARLSARAQEHQIMTKTLGGGVGWGWGGYRQGGGDSSRALSSDWSGCFRARERPDLGEWRLVEVPPHLRGRVQTWRDGNRCGARAQVLYRLTCYK